MPGRVADLGCGSGRLFRSLLDGGATRILGIDGSAALLRRAEARIASDAVLTTAARQGRIELLRADLRHLGGRHPGDCTLVIMAGVVAHLDGPQGALDALTAAARLLADGGRLVVDTIGPGGLPERDLPLSVDWRRRMGEREVVRRSSLVRRQAPEGLRVLLSTLTDVPRADGTIARLSAGYRLWYPSPRAIQRLVAEAGLAVETAFGSHDLDPLEAESQRCIIVASRTAAENARMG